VSALALAPPPPVRPGRVPLWVGASLALHLLLAAAALWPPRPMPQAMPEQQVSLIWAEQGAGAGDPQDRAPELPGGVALPPAPPQAEAPPPPLAAAPPLAPVAAPIPPGLVAAPPLVGPPLALPDIPPAPPLARAPPAPTSIAIAPPVAPPPPPAEAAPPVPMLPRLAEAPPPTPEASLESPPPRPRSAPPQPRRASPTPGPGNAPQAAPPMAAAPAEATGAVSPPRQLAGIGNPSPEYPYASRIRQEQGRVTLRVLVSPAGGVADVAVERTSGHAALDRAAEQAVRRWRFEPAMQDGRPVPASAAISITFRLDGDRRW